MTHLPNPLLIENFHLARKALNHVSENGTTLETAQRIVHHLLPQLRYELIWYRNWLEANLEWAPVLADHKRGLPDLAELDVCKQHLQIIQDLVRDLPQLTENVKHLLWEYQRTA